MKTYNDYLIRVDFLPKKGRVFVDSCGLGWLPGDGKGNVERDLAKIYKVSEFDKKFRERGNVLTSPLVFEEIRSNIKHYLKLQDATRKKGKEGCGKVERKFLDAKLRVYEEAEEVYSKVCNTLESGMNKHFDERVFCSDAIHFAENFSAELSLPDRELVASALYSGNDCGILSSDDKMLGVYMAGVSEFGLERCFISDSEASELEML